MGVYIASVIDSYQSCIILMQLAHFFLFVSRSSENRSNYSCLKYWIKTCIL